MTNVLGWFWSTGRDLVLIDVVLLLLDCFSRFVSWFWYLIFSWTYHFYTVSISAALLCVISFHFFFIFWFLVWILPLCDYKALSPIPRLFLFKSNLKAYFMSTISPQVSVNESSTHLKKSKNKKKKHFAVLALHLRNILISGLSYSNKELCFVNTLMIWM